MPRGFSAAQKAALAAGVVGVSHFAELDLSTGFVRAWDGVGTITALGVQWLGVGEYGLIDGLENDRGATQRGITLTLHGVPSDSLPGGAVAATRATPYQRRPVRVLTGISARAGGALIGDPVVIWSGLADVMTFALGATVTCTLTAEHATEMLRQTNGLRATTESHMARLPTGTARDTFFDMQSRYAAISKMTV